jgi:hypothetical protein
VRNICRVSEAEEIVRSWDHVGTRSPDYLLTRYTVADLIADVDAAIRESAARTDAA